jgi:Asp-tRNA(Asn)/Glu-tRNA(Gln) amidotransferase C subunit
LSQQNLGEGKKVNAFRPDEVLPRDNAAVEKLIAGFPDKKGDYIKVKTIL